MVTLLVFLRLVETAEVRVLVSTATPPSIVSMISDFSSYLDQFATFSSEQDVSDYNASIVLDYLYNETLSTVLRSVLGSQHEYVGMWNWNENLLEHQKLNFSVSQFSNYISLINLSQVVLISDTQEFNLRVTAFAIENFPDQYRQRFVIPTDSDEGFCQHFVARTIKPRGVRYIALFTNEVTTSHILSALRAHKMDKDGSVVILSEEASYYRYVSNSSTLQHSQVLVVAENTAEAESYLEVQRLRLINLISHLRNIQRQFVACAYVAPAYNLYKIRVLPQQSLSILATDPFNYTGQGVQEVTSQLSPLPKLPIDISVNYDFLEPNGQEAPFSATVMRGFQIAVDEVNTRYDVIPDYKIRENSVGFTGVTFDFNVTRQRVKENREKVGLIYMSPPVAQSVVGVFSVFQSLNLSVPITGSCLGSELSSKEKYPLYIRTRPKNEYVLNILCRALIGFGWKKIAVLYQQDRGEFQEAYSIFKRLAEVYHINITNSEKSRCIPYSFSGSAPQEMNDSLAEVMQSDTQVILLLTNIVHLDLQRMYDAGFRGDHAILLLAGLTANFFTGPQFFRQRVVSKGAFMFFPDLFVGDVGERVRKQLIRYDNSSYFSSTCLYYDAAMLYFHATDFLLEHGKDFEDPQLIVETMRKTRFQGCSGLVQIDPDSNDRASGEIAISNFHYDSDSDTYEIKVVGSYNPYISEVMHIHWDEIQWPNGESSFSDSKPNYRDCNYLARDISISPIGKAAGIAICFFLAFLVCNLEFFIWKSKSHARVTIITHRFYVSHHDVLSFVTAMMQFFILSSIGPSTTRIRSALHGVFTLVFEGFFESESGTFWQRHYCVLAISAWWTALRYLKRCNKSLHSLLAFNDSFASMMTRVFYVPFAAFLLQIFVCSKGRSQKITDTILDNDCNTMCWSKMHTIYAVFSGIVFLAFSAETVRYELSLEEKDQDLHIQDNPQVVAIRHVLHLALVASFASIRTHSPDVHAYIHLASISLYFAITIVLTETNYARLNLWSTALHFAVVLMSLIALISQKVDTLTVPFLVYPLLFAYGLILAGVGFVQWKVPKYESKLVRRRGLDIRHLLEFGFTAGKRAQNALKKYISEKTLHADTNQHFELEI